MDWAEARQIAVFLLDCEKALYDQGRPQGLALYLDSLCQIVDRIKDAAPDRADRDVRFALALAMKKARRLRQKMEDRLGMRN